MRRLQNIIGLRDHLFFLLINYIRHGRVELVNFTHCRVYVFPIFYHWLSDCDQLLCKWFYCGYLLLWIIKSHIFNSLSYIIKHFGWDCSCSIKCFQWCVWLFFWWGYCFNVWLLHTEWLRQVAQLVPQDFYCIIFVQGVSCMFNYVFTELAIFLHCLLVSC